MNILELSSRLEIETQKIADEMICHLRRDPEYLAELADIERKLAVMACNDCGSVLIKRINGRFIY